MCRRVLRRSGTGALAAGDDRLELRSRVQLLDGPFFEGQYMLGSVNFVRMADSGTSLAPGCTLSSPGMAIGKLGPCQSDWPCCCPAEDEAAGASKSGAGLSSSVDWATGGLPKPYLDGVFGSGKGRMLTALEARFTPTHELSWAAQSRPLISPESMVVIEFTYVAVG